MANTLRIKRSTTVATPTALAQGELAYSESSDNLFIGTNSSTLQKIGGNADVIKLAAIEYGATADQSAAQIKTKYEGEASAFTDAQFTKLSGIETGATADQTSTEIRDAVEAASNSNTFTDADHSKLNAIEASATADQTNAEIKAAVEAATDSNTFTDADHSKLNAIAASANNYVLPASVIHQTELSSSTSSTSTTVAANSAAVKSAYDTGNHSHPYLSSSHDASAVTTAKIGEWDAAHTWYDSMTTADADGVIDTVNEIVAVFQNHSESLNLITELDAKLTANSTIDGGTF